MLTRQLPLIMAIVVCLLGCDKEAQPSADRPVKPPTDAVSAPATGQTNEMQTTASGLKYMVLKRGTGNVSPKPTDTVTVHYRGTLMDGSVFDSSIDRGQPASFPLNGVIPGWTEGLQLMKVGDKFKFQIPPGLAYGHDGRPPVIPPDSTLVFEVELLSIP